MNDTFNPVLTERNADLEITVGDHVDHARYYMFQEATDAVLGRLQAICKMVYDAIVRGMKAITNSMMVDYMRVLGE